MSEGGAAGALEAAPGDETTTTITTTTTGDPGAGAAAGGGDGGGAGAGGGTGGGEAGATWYEGLPDDDKTWLANKKFGDVGATVKAYRDLERQYLGGDKIVLPKEGASEEERNAFYAKIGRPEKPEGYEIKAPEGAQLDERLVGRFREAAFKAGVPAGMATPLVEAFNAHVVEVTEEREAARTQAKVEGVKAVTKEWGDQFPQNMSAAKRAMTMLELDGDAVGAIEDGLEERYPGEGTKKTLDLLRKLGAGMGEDVLTGGGGGNKFGKSPAEAQAELDRQTSDKDFQKRLAAKEPEAIAVRQRMMEIVAEAEDKASRAGG